MTAQYRYVGTYSRIYDTQFEFKKFGQLVEMDEETAKGCPFLIPAQQFDAVFNGASDADLLTKFGDVARHHLAPPDFVVKRKKVWAMIGKPATALIVDQSEISGEPPAGVEIHA